jgi:3-hydroxyisobutyrate dehydrogenase
MLRVGFIGLGAMGKPMALNLIKAGFTVFVNDISEVAAKSLEELGAVACLTPKDMATKVDVVITMLGNADIVRSVLVDENGFLQKSRPEQVIIDMSSVAPGSAISMANIARKFGVDYIDAPVSGGVAGAKEGTLTIMIGGELRVVDKVRPIMQSMGKNLYHIGDIGAGDAMKLVNNMMLGINMVAVTEALVVGTKLGLKPQTMLDVIKVSSGRSFITEAKAPNFILPGKFLSGFAIDLQYKDLGLAIESAKSMGIPIPVTVLSQQLYEAARAKGLGREDITAVIKVLEELAGVEVRA